MKIVAGRCPEWIQNELKRLRYAWLIRRDKFSSPEIEFDALKDWIVEGDWVIDVGANVGHYTKRFSDLVGAKGRVMAFEPVASTFELLAANCAVFRNQNVSLFNVAASNQTKLAGISIPSFDTGLLNYYQAQLTESSSDFTVLCLPIDTLGIKNRVSVVKIDAEGHDYDVLMGMKELIERDRPTLIIEEVIDEMRTFLVSLDYKRTNFEGSPNTIFTIRTI